MSVSASGWEVASKEWERMQIKAFTAWVNSVLVAPGVGEDLVHGFADGARFAELVQALSGSQLRGIVDQPKNRLQALANASLAVDALCAFIPSMQGLLSPSNVVDGEKTSVLGAIWVMFKETVGRRTLTEDYEGADEPSPRPGATHAKASLSASLLAWCRAQTGLEVADFQGAFSDGRVLCALLASDDPAALAGTAGAPEGDWEAWTAEQRLTTALACAHTAYAIPELLDPAAMMGDPAHIDKHSVEMLLTLLRVAFRGAAEQRALTAQVSAASEAAEASRAAADDRVALLEAQLAAAQATIARQQADIAARDADLAAKTAALADAEHHAEVLGEEVQRLHDALDGLADKAERTGAQVDWDRAYIERLKRANASGRELLGRFKARMSSRIHDVVEFLRRIRALLSVHDGVDLIQQMYPDIPHGSMPPGHFATTVSYEGRLGWRKRAIVVVDNVVVLYKTNNLDSAWWSHRLDGMTVDLLDTEFITITDDTGKLVAKYRPHATLTAPGAFEQLYLAMCQRTRFWNNLMSVLRAVYHQNNWLYTHGDEEYREPDPIDAMMLARSQSARLFVHEKEDATGTVSYVIDHEFSPRPTPHPVGPTGATSGGCTPTTGVTPTTRVTCATTDDDDDSDNDSDDSDNDSDDSDDSDGGDE